MMLFVCWLALVYSVAAEGLNATKFDTLQDSCPAEVTMVDAGEDCDANKLCKPMAKKKTVDLDYEFTSSVEGQLVCIKAKCVEDYSIANDEACEEDRSCKSMVCTGGKCKTPLERPDAVDDNCGQGLCFGDDLQCESGKCKKFTYAKEGDACELVTSDGNKMCDPSSEIQCFQKTCTARGSKDDECSAGLTKVSCKSDLYCNSDNKCAEWVGKGDECDSDWKTLLGTRLKRCKVPYLCESDECTDPADDVTPSPPPACVRPKVGDACGGILSAAIDPWQCNCDNEWLVCNDRKWAARWSVAAGSDTKATTAEVCLGEWWDKANEKCVSELTCEKQADCLSPADPDANVSPRIVYCDCDDNKCKFLDGYSFSCTEAQITSNAKDYCEFKHGDGATASSPALGTIAAFAAWLKLDGGDAGDVQDTIDFAADSGLYLRSKTLACLGGIDFSVSKPSPPDSADSGASYVTPQFMILGLIVSLFYLMYP